MRQRTTRQLSTTHAVLEASHDHPTAEQVLERVRVVLPNISLGTVYRNLEKLRDQGRLRILQLCGVAHYDAVVEEHDHFICEACGALIDLDHAPSGPYVHDLEKAGYAVHWHTRAVYGLCRVCNAASARACGGERHAAGPKR